jgi:ferredoxin
MPYIWKLITRNCTGCGICADVCNYSAIVMSRNDPYPNTVPGACTGCLTCVEECPFDAIEVIESQEREAS